VGVTQKHRKDDALDKPRKKPHGPPSTEVPEPHHEAPAEVVPVSDLTLAGPHPLHEDALVKVSKRLAPPSIGAKALFSATWTFLVAYAAYSSISVGIEVTSVFGALGAVFSLFSNWTSLLSMGFFSLVGIGGFSFVWRLGLWDKLVSKMAAFRDGILDDLAARADARRQAPRESQTVRDALVRRDEFIRAREVARDGLEEAKAILPVGRELARACTELRDKLRHAQSILRDDAEAMQEVSAALGAIDAIEEALDDARLKDEAQAEVDQGQLPASTTED